MIQTIDRPKVSDPLLHSFRQIEDQVKDPRWLLPLRKAGLARFSELGFPTTAHEDWRFTNVAPLQKLPFRPAGEGDRATIARKQLEQFPFGNIAGSRLVFINGHFSPELSTVQRFDEGVQVKSMAAALRGGGATIEKHLAHYARATNNAFAALNTAYFLDGAFIHVPAGKKIADPVQLLYLTTTEVPGVTVHPRNLIIADKNSQFTLIETYASLVDTAYFTNPVSEFILGDNASVEHCKYQVESPNAYHIATQHFELGQAANFLSHSIALGAKLSRNNIYTVLGGEGIECVLNGLYITREEQLADHWMLVEHVKPHCNSHEYFNGILEERSKGVFHGRILVQPAAQKTDAKQTNKNLLLSDEATADTKPQLEIYADDVKCTHGATIGQLDDESIFYLRARGIGAETARRILIHAFAGEIIDRIKCEALRAELDQIIWERLEQNPEIAERK